MAENRRTDHIVSRLPSSVSTPFPLRALQKYYYHRYGTTLRGLMLEDEVFRADDFLAFVHDIDRSSLQPNFEPAVAMAALPGRPLDPDERLA